MSDYRPIDCGLHSEYELAILRAQHLRLRWRDEQDRVRQEVVLPTDLQTRHHEEFLIARDPAGGQLRIRLDRILGFERTGRHGGDASPD
ncbi:MAG TPA: transcriptional antiterminator, Rof [Gammaproteobacteria bacterium]|nr:transcriptional antiterminator, Rof [Gammaproteobacteria bacterium]